jgi:hypothetical protein
MQYGMRQAKSALEQYLNDKRLPEAGQPAL